MPSIAGVLRGMGAGLAGTAAMTACMELVRAFRPLGKEPPRQVTESLLGRLKVLPPTERGRTAVTALAHLGFGAAMGGVFALLPRGRSCGRGRNMTAGALFGVAVWATSYGGLLPVVELVPPPPGERPERALENVVEHVVYGTVLGALTPGRA